MEKINYFFSGITMTLIGGLFLLLSFLNEHLNLTLPCDCAWFTVIICGIPLLYLAIERLLTHEGISKISSEFLICIAITASIIIHDVFAAGVIAFIMAIGAILEEKTTERAKKGLKKLIALTPTQGRKLINNKAIMVATSDIQLNDILRVLPGETIPVDGVIISGNSSVNQAIMTGESLPIDKTVDDDVFCGTLNCFGSIDIRATKVGEDSSLQKLIRMVQEAEDKKAPISRITDVWASWLVPAALLLAIITYFVTHEIVRAVTILVVFCPCALVLATPTAIMAAIGQATKQGIIIKSGEALEKMGKIDTITFDKTGTLTHGQLKVDHILDFTDDYDKQSILLLTASAEALSEHPLAKAIVNHANQHQLTLYDCQQFTMAAGKGITAQINQQFIYCGNEKYLATNNIIITNTMQQQIDHYRQEGKVALLTAINKQCIGAIILSDTIRQEAQQVIKKLQAMSTHVVLLTGDNYQTAHYFANKMGIQQVYANLLPEEKVQHIQKFNDDNHKVCMIGDGVNDAPALKTAHVGIAMGSMGSDIAIEAADIALVNDDISKLPYLKRLSNATVNTIKFSISLSLIINFIAIILSLMGILTPTTGAFMHNAGSVLVVMIAALLYDRKFD